MQDTHTLQGGLVGDAGLQPRDVSLGEVAAALACCLLSALCLLLILVHISAPDGERWAERKNKATSGFVPAPS